MAQFKKDVYNLAPGPGQAIDDPRVGEELARNADARAAQELALRRQAQAQQQALAQRQMALSEQSAAFEQALAGQARGGMTPAYGDGQAAAPAARSGPAPAMGRDALMRQANNAAAQEKQFRYQMNAGLDLDSVFGQPTLTDGRQGMGPVGTARLPEDAGSTGELDRGAWIDKTGAVRGGNAGYNRGGGVTVSSTGPRAPMGGGEVLQAGMSVADAMNEALGLEDRQFSRNLADRKMLAEEMEIDSVDRSRRSAERLAEKNQGWTQSFSEKEASRNYELRQVALSQEWSKVKTAQDAQKWQQKFAESEALRDEEQRMFDRYQTARTGEVQRDVMLRGADREDTAQTFQISQATSAMDQATKQEVYQFLTSDEDVMQAVHSGQASPEAAIKLEMFRRSDPARFGPIVDTILGGPNVQDTARDAGHRMIAPRDNVRNPYDPRFYWFGDSDRDREGPAQSRFNRSMGVGGVPPSPADNRTPLTRRMAQSAGRGLDRLSTLPGRMKQSIEEMIFGPSKKR